VDAREKIIVALDHPELENNLKVLDRLKDEVKFVKVGSILFCKTGPSVLKQLTSRGLKIFLDLKFHDIPNTVSGAIEAVLDCAPSLMTCHASGGSGMIREARKTLDRFHSSSKLLAVTLLTSLGKEDVSQIGFSDGPEAQVERLAKMALNSGADGLVCSPQEVGKLSEQFPKGLFVVPGIRSDTLGKDDQKRTATPEQAIRDGASYIVVGRPISEAKDPKAEFLKIVERIS
jgi:orotidine-5'-phosphate decarboxylase